MGWCQPCPALPFCLARRHLELALKCLRAIVVTRPRTTVLLLLLLLLLGVWLCGTATAACIDLSLADPSYFVLLEALFPFSFFFAMYFVLVR